MRFIGLIVVLALVVGIGLLFFDVEINDAGQLPDIDVSVQDSGRLPDVSVTAKDVDVTTEERTVEVPKIVVND